MSEVLEKEARRQCKTDHKHPSLSSLFFSLPGVDSKSPFSGKEGHSLSFYLEK